jgi:hypothetical protein
MGRCEEKPLANPQVGSIPYRDLQPNRFVETTLQASAPGPTQETACGLKVGTLTNREG